MNRIRLAILAKFLLTVPEEKFSLQTWKCGTTACAVGWACTIPEFKEEGLSYYDESNQHFAPKYKGEWHFDAVDEFFDISYRDSLWLFGADQDGYNTPIQVVARICDLMKLSDEGFPPEDYESVLENEIRKQREKAKASKA